jgi:predicted signal transduction protein with EAL and GGDEF domain
LLARLGGDEFAVLAHGDAAAGEALALDVHTTLARPVALRGVAVHIAASIGVADDSALDGRDAAAGRTADALLRLADLAMYRAKRQRRGGLARYEPGSEPTVDRLHLTEQLRGALRGDDPDVNGTLLVDVQPQVALDAVRGGRGRVVGAEALVRWRHPDEGVLAPGAFLPLADNAGLLPSLADVVLDAALAACRRWWDVGHRLPVAVNVSVGDVLDHGFVERVVAVLRAHDLPARALTVELTEETLLVDPPRARAVLAELRALGVGASIDDYGSGYSSLAYLRELPADELKLDRAFVVDLAREATPTSRAAAIVRTTADLAHSLGLRLVAEGVEDDDTLALLALLGCDVAQGYGIARPMPPARFLDWLAQPVGVGRTAASATTG